MFIPIYNNETQESEVKVKMVDPLSESEYALVFSVPPFNFRRWRTPLLHSRIWNWL